MEQIVLYRHRELRRRWTRELQLREVTLDREGVRSAQTRRHERSERRHFDREQNALRNGRICCYRRSTHRSLPQTRNVKTRIKETARTGLSVITTGLRIERGAWSTLHLGPEFPFPMIAECARSVENASRNCTRGLPIRCAIRGSYF